MDASILSSNVSNRKDVSCLTSFDDLVEPDIKSRNDEYQHLSIVDKSWPSWEKEESVG